MNHGERSYTVDESKAFVELVDIAPLGSGELDGLRFAVKDIIDVAGSVTGCGNPDWRRTHAPAATHAVCVEQLLSAGARIFGRTVTDELAFSLLGENHFDGTPLNPRGPDRVPGGSSAGSASAVACGIVDFALGTDTGGSVRVPASNCGIFGYRPSHGFISVAGVMPFATTYDTVGVFARKAEVLVKAASVLLGREIPEPAPPERILCPTQLWDLADPAVGKAMDPFMIKVEGLWPARIQSLDLRQLDGEPDGTSMKSWLETYSILQWGEVWSNLGTWITEHNPTFGPVTTKSFELPRNLDRRRIQSIIRRRERYFDALRKFLRPTDLLCIPTSPTVAPLVGSIRSRQTSPEDYYPRALSMTSLSGVGRLPQISLPVADVEGLPAGLSFLAPHAEDVHLLGIVRRLAELLDD